MALRLGTPAILKVHYSPGSFSRCVIQDLREGYNRRRTDMREMSVFLEIGGDLSLNEGMRSFAWEIRRY